MAQIIPPITSLPIDSLAAPSAEDIQDRLPSICVDYLSHDWSEEDVWASWRSMTRHKHEIANGVRLENASWRTWNKQRNKLKTISPETLNWLKDSDVTWLYGPLHTATVEPVRPHKIATTDERLGIDRPTIKGRRAPSKPILKHRTLSEMLTIPAPSSPILEATQPDSSSDSGNEGEQGGSASSRPVLIQTRSDTNIANSRTSGVRVHTLPKPPAGIDVSQPRDASHGTPPVVSPSEPKEKKHISFNTFVEQCQAIPDQDLPITQPTPESDDEMLEIRSNSSRSSRNSRGSRPSFSRQSSSGSGASDHLTIAMIAPTMLKTNGSYASTNMPQMVYAPPPEYQSPSEEIARSPRAQMQARVQAQQSSHDFPSPTMRKQQLSEDDDEYGSAGYDYFEGPSYGSQTAPVHIGGYGRDAPQVNQAPSQPKWRQQPGSEPSSVTSSSSVSPGGHGGIMSPPVPSRGILKVRQPGSTPPEPASPPQSSYFNYNPSPATGIGGMRGSYEYPSLLEGQGAQPGQAGQAGQAQGGQAGTNSPLLSPATQETRGRSAQRVGSAADNRSASRGTSTSSASMSPGAVRTPPAVDGGRPIQVRSPPIPPQAAAQAAAPPPQEVVQATPAEMQGKEAMEVDEDSARPYEPERSNTPTPHSSPQISLRPLKDTSPASLPHTSSRPPPQSAHSTSSTSTPTTASTQIQTPTTAPPPAQQNPQPSSSQQLQRQSSQSSTSSASQPIVRTASSQSNRSNRYADPDADDNVPSSPELPKADPPTSISPPSRPLVRSNSGGRRTQRASTSGRATIAHVGTNAMPTLLQPEQGQQAQAQQAQGSDGAQISRQSSAQGEAYGSGSAAAASGSKQPGGERRAAEARTGEADDGEMSDGGGIMDRAATIASSARELLGGWWYGDGQGQGPAGQGGAGGQGHGQGRGMRGSVLAGFGGGFGPARRGGEGDATGQAAPGDGPASAQGTSRGPWGRHRRGASLG